MSKIIPNPPPGFDDLPVDEQIDYVQTLWERIAASPEKVPVPEWHLRILKEREEVYKATPGSSRPWEEARAELERKLHERRSK
jgi:putative addiction module component (TIGR02574 family)